jgi:hypothetical protein
MTRSARCCQPDWSRHGLTVDTRVLIVNDYYSRKLAPYTPGKDILVEAASPPGGLSYNCREFPGVPGSSPPRLVCNTTPPGFTPENCPELLQACNHISCGVAFPSHQIPVPTSPSPAKQTAFALKKKNKKPTFQTKNQKNGIPPKLQKTEDHPSSHHHRLNCSYTHRPNAHSAVSVTPHRRFSSLPPRGAPATQSPPPPRAAVAVASAAAAAAAAAAVDVAAAAVPP